MGAHALQLMLLGPLAAATAGAAEAMEAQLIDRLCSRKNGPQVAVASSMPTHVTVPAYKQA